MKPVQGILPLLALALSACVTGGAPEAWGPPPGHFETETATTAYSRGGGASATPGAVADWLPLSGRAVRMPDGRAFFGVGSAEGVRNAVLARSVADNRARADVMAVWEGYAGVIGGTVRAFPMRDQLRLDASAGDGTPGVVVIARGTSGGTAYSLAVVDVDATVAAIARALDLDPPSRARFLEVAAERFDEVASARARKSVHRVTESFVRRTRGGSTSAAARRSSVRGPWEGEAQASSEAEAAGRGEARAAPS